MSIVIRIFPIRITTSSERIAVIIPPSIIAIAVVISIVTMSTPPARIPTVNFHDFGGNDCQKLYTTIQFCWELHTHTHLIPFHISVLKPLLNNLNQRYMSSVATEFNRLYLSLSSVLLSSSLSRLSSFCNFLKVSYSFGLKGSYSSMTPRNDNNASDPMNGDPITDTHSIFKQIRQKLICPFNVVYVEKNI